MLRQQTGQNARNTRKSMFDRYVTQVWRIPHLPSKVCSAKTMRFSIMDHPGNLIIIGTSFHRPALLLL